MVPWRPSPVASPLPSGDQERGEHGEHEAERRNSQHTSSSLPSELPPEMIRGTALDVCLRWWGANFWSRRSSDGYRLSQRVGSIDYFLSHDWATSPTSKTLALLLFFNGTPAALATVCISILCCGLLMANRLPGGWPTASFSTHSTFVLVFCFWQRVRCLLRCRVPIVFLDRLCIAQHDPDLKRQGILGLAGFLAKSEQLAILWTPRTFSRLWCTFELAHFLRPEGGGKPVKIVPVAMVSSLLLIFITNTVFWGFFHVWLFMEEWAFMGVDSSSIWLANLLAGAVLAPILIFCWALQVSIGMQHARDLSGLEAQMQNFSVREAECSCCTFNHVDPATGQDIICDRQLVFQTLRRWYGGGGDEDHLDNFDGVVHAQMKGFVMKGLGSSIPPARFILALMVASPLALLPQYIHLGLHRIKPYNLGLSNGHVDEEWIFWQWPVAFLHVPAVTLFFFWLGINIPRVGLSLCSKLRRSTAVVLLVVLKLLLLACFWFPFCYFSLSKTPDRYLAVFISMYGLLLGLYAWQYRSALASFKG
ncbi:unnamed protein product [Symbiodinium natans]|uniref:Uncharacterized protein n=1 Tax=Symbiodinium natans TaxID=878477 RepID=A0A812SUL4_9DINO|nr:unnamed protein product [Symbiodinium natans]